MPASQGNIFQTPSCFSLIWITNYGAGNLRCTARTHLPWVGFIFPEASPVRQNGSQGSSPGRHNFFQHCPYSSALHLPRVMVCLQLCRAPFPLQMEASGRSRRGGRDGRWRSGKGRESAPLSSRDASGSQTHCEDACSSHGTLQGTLARNKMSCARKSSLPCPLEWK